MNNNIYAYSTPELIRNLGMRFRDYRMAARLTQKELSERSGVTVATIHNFETGKSGNISMAVLLQLLRAIGYLEALDNFLPEMPENPYLYDSSAEKKIQRIRHK